ncbi:hypothetical protein BC628DRAFT_1416205 [Trametes gibbosa]|nr:hypothetical protein BC628DRAFT_1416205 [Trametes gibbosa]
MEKEPQPDSRAMPCLNATSEQASARMLEELTMRPLVDIAKELSSLREEAALLREEKRVLENLKLEMNTLRKEKAALKGAVKYLMGQTGCLPGPTYQPPASPNSTRLPHELLLTIFRESRAPCFQLDPSVMRSMHSLWLSELRYRKGLVLVCKHWFAPATEQLYEDIVLRRMGQILALADTLAADMRRPGTHRGIARWVKRIRLDRCFIVWQCADAVREALCTIFSLCTALRAFEHHIVVYRFYTPPHLTGWGCGTFFSRWFAKPPPGAFRIAYRERLSTLTVLDLAFTLSYDQATQIHELLSAAKNLETLKLLSVKRVQGEEDALDFQTVLDLPRLMELYVPVADGRFVACVSKAWKMPRLQRLTTLETFSTPRDLLASHGSRLKYVNLHLDSTWTPVSAPSHEDVGVFVELCPLLEHLVLPPCVSYPWAWTTHMSYNIISSLERMNGDPPFVSRTLWLPAPTVDLPAICSPETPLQNGEYRLVTFAGMRFRQYRSAVLPEFACPSMPLPFSGLDEEDADDSASCLPPEDADSGDESSFVESSSVSDEDYTAADLENEVEDQERENKVEDESGSEDDGESESETFSEDDPEYDWGPDQQLDFSTALAMFRKTAS